MAVGNAAEQLQQDLWCLVCRDHKQRPLGVGRPPVTCDKLSCRRTWRKWSAKERKEAGSPLVPPTPELSVVPPPRASGVAKARRGEARDMTLDIVQEALMQVRVTLGDRHIARSAEPQKPWKQLYGELTSAVVVLVRAVEDLGNDT